MPMFDDPQKELEQLQAKILEQEDWFEKELDSAKRMIGDMSASGKPQSAAAQPKAAPVTSAPTAAAAKTAPVRNYANGYGTQPIRKNVQPLKPEEDYDREELEPKKKGIRGLVILALLETAGILVLGGYWLMYFLG